MYILIVCDKSVTTQNLAFLSYWYRILQNRFNIVTLPSSHSKQLRWPRGSVLPLNTQVSRFFIYFSGRKNPQHVILRKGSNAVSPTLQICSMKKILNGVEVVIQAKLPELSCPHSSTFCCQDLSRRCGRGGTWRQKWECLKRGGDRIVQ